MTVSTIKASGGDFSTLSGWEAAQAATLTAPAEAECYDFDLDDTLSIAGITTSAANYIRIYTPTTERHDGRSRTVSGTGFRIKRTATGGTVFSINTNYCRLEGLEIEATDPTTSVFGYGFGTFAAGANDQRVEKCIIHGTQTGSGYVFGASVANLALAIRNCIVYGSNRSIDTRNAAAVEISNCTFWRHADQLGIVAETELTCKNTYSGKASGTTEDFSTAAAAPSGSNNASSDASAAIDYTSSQTGVAGSSVFTSVTAGAEDFTLKAGTNALVDNGATLAAVSDDIIGTARPQNSVYDIGAFERAAAGGGTHYDESIGIAASAGFSSAGAAAYSESISVAASPTFSADGSLHFSGSISLGASAGASASAALSAAESVSFAATLTASAAAALTMREAIDVMATAAASFAASSPADVSLVRVVRLAGSRTLTITLAGRRDGVIRLRGSLSQ